MPNIIRVPEPYASNQMYSRIKEASQILGEEFIALSMYHVNRDEENQPRCACFDSDYGANQSATCPYCYATTFAGGIKEVWRVWGIMTDDDEDETKSKNGVWMKEGHQVQLEPWPELIQNDYILRVKQWDTSRQAPLILGSFYVISSMQDVTLRTGNRYGGSAEDRIAQKATISLLPESHPINTFQVQTEVTFPRYDGQPR